jgi:hypothetical protein
MMIRTKRRFRGTDAAFASMIIIIDPSRWCEVLVPQPF